MAPPYIDDNPEIEMVEKGLRIAEIEKRDAMISQYEKRAIAGSDPEKALDDISYPNDAGFAGDPELSEMKRKLDTES